MWVCVRYVANFESICSENVINTEDSQKGSTYMYVMNILNFSIKYNGDSIYCM